MKTTPNRLAELLADAERLRPDYLARTADLRHESKGIRRSEMFFLYAALARLQPRSIVESGRARAQSTLVLARLFPEATIVSLESDPHSPDVPIAAERLRECRNVESRFGDSLRLLPEIVQPGDVVLIDGPKDFRALRLAFKLLAQRGAAAVFVHDLWLGSPARAFVDRSAPHALLSDEPAWVERYAALDRKRPPSSPAAAAKRRAYGATLGYFETGAESYSLLGLQARAAQGIDRVRETMRRALHRPPQSRPKDFA